MEKRRTGVLTDRGLATEVDQNPDSPPSIWYYIIASGRQGYPTLSLSLNPILTTNKHN